MDIRIKTIEDLSLNAWPSHQIQFYDGWLLRFSYFYTHRTNCVEQIGASSIPVDAKIRYCENEYSRWGTPAIFKISPLVSTEFDRILEKKGYVTEHLIDNMVIELPACDSVSGESLSADPAADDKLTGSASDDQLTGSASDDNLTVSCSRFITPAWIDALFRLKNTTNIMHKTVVPSMYQAIPKETFCISLHSDNKIFGTGLGILDRDYIGIYAIHVKEEFRRQGLARRICRGLLSQGLRRGARNAYLQVVHDNKGAQELYHSLGFRTQYTYWFRVQQINGSFSSPD